VVVLALLMLAGAAVWWFWPGRASSGRAGLAPPPQAVGIATAASADIPILQSGLGTVTPLATITVQTQISGLLQSVNFTEGQIVHQGDVLAQIDPRPYEALLAQARGALQRDQALLAQAEADEKRYITLNRQDSISRQQAEDQHFLVLQDRGTVAADQGTIQTQLVNLAFCRITAPVTGRVGLRQVDAGNYVTPSLSSGLVVLTQLQPISVIFTLPEDDLPQIMQRLGAGAKLPVTVFDRDNTAQLGTGVLQAVDTQIDTTTGTVKLRALFDNAGNVLFPNQFVNANLLVDTHSNVVTVPNAALQTGAPGTFVYVVKPDNTVTVRVVKTGAADAAHTEITHGLQVGERVVIDGADRLREGAAVTVPAGTPAAPPPRKHHWHHSSQE
jgi:multidrug efflux system membrane fusion protein